MMTVQEALKENDRKFEKLGIKEDRACIIARIAVVLTVISVVSFVANISIEYPSLANTCTFWIFFVSTIISAIMTVPILLFFMELPYHFESLKNERRGIEDRMKEHAKYYD